MIRKSWALRYNRLFMGALYDGPVAFVDVETTGATPGAARVIEIGMVAASAGQLEYEWSTLVDPGVRIPPSIQQFTGITEELIRAAPSFAQIAGQLAERMPEAPGVYRFFGADDVLLYVGKAKCIRERVFSHWQAALCNSRAQRLVLETRRVDWIETAGELGALLAEAQQVRELRPLYNRRLRGGGGLYTWVVADDGAAPLLAPLDQLPLSFERSDPFGLYRSERAARAALVALARDHDLCLKALGLEPTRGSCFAFQLGRCAGACVGAEPLARHALRLKLAFAPQRLAPWPYRGPVAIREEGATEGRCEVHVIDGWRHVATLAAGEDPDLPAKVPPFDPDVYQILRRHMRLTAGRGILPLPATWRVGAGRALSDE